MSIVDACCLGLGGSTGGTARGWEWYIKSRMSMIEELEVDYH